MNGWKERELNFSLAQALGSPHSYRYSYHRMTFPRGVVHPFVNGGNVRGDYELQTAGVRLTESSRKDTWGTKAGGRIP